MFTVTNLTSDAVGVGNVYLNPNQSRDYPYVTSEVVDAVNSGLLSIDPPVTVSTTNVTALTNSSGGTVSNTIAAMDGGTLTGVDGTGSNAAPLAGVNTQLGLIRDAVSSLAAKVNEVIAISNPSADNVANLSAQVNDHMN